jgi:hypothetical protein
MRRASAVLAACLLIVAFIEFAAPGRALAQTPTATIFVEVRDQTGAPLKDAFITVTNQANGIGRSGDTNAEGALVVPLLPAGTYTLTAALDKFKTEIISDIQVQAAVKGVLAITLTPGPYSDHVVVRADATTLRIGNSTVGEVFDSQTLLSLPVNERDPIQFTYQAAGVSTPAPGSRLSTQGNIGLNSSGAREASNNFLLDGVDNNDLTVTLNSLRVIPEAVGEVQVQTASYSAEFGRSSGAQFSAVTKSGTNQFHGEVWEY